MYNLLIRTTPPPKPDYVHPKLHGNAFVVLGSTLFSIACLFVFARLYARIVIVRRFGADDFFMVLAIITRAAHFALSYCMAYEWYMNRHVQDIPPLAMGHTFKELWILHHVTYASLLCIKISILLFYLRILSRVQNKVMRWTIIGTIIFVTAYTIAISLAYAFNCNPVSSYWMQHVKSWAATHKHSCLDIKVIPMFAAIVNVITDFWITSLPILFIGRLNLPLNQRRALYIVFSLGFLATASSAIQAYVIHLMLYKGHADVSWHYYDVLVWAELEDNLAIICACAPALKAFWSQINQDRTKSWKSYYGGGASSEATKGKSAASASKNTFGSRSRGSDSVRDLIDDEDAKEKGDRPWLSRSGGGVTKSVTVELEPVAKPN